MKKALFVLEVRRAGGHGDECFTAMVDSHFGLVLAAARMLESTGGYHGFSHAERHATTIRRLVPGMFYRHRTAASSVNRIDDTCVFIRRPSGDPLGDGSEWKEEWLDRGLMREYAPAGRYVGD